MFERSVLVTLHSVSLKSSRGIAGRDELVLVCRKDLLSNL